MNGIQQGIGPYQFGTITSISNTAIVDVARDDISGGNVVYGNMRTGMLQLYNRALTNAEILQNYNATKGRFGL
jgi:predicted transcriptional regulator